LGIWGEFGLEEGSPITINNNNVLSQRIRDMGEGDEMVDLIN
jgi:hypothetical protein